MRHPASRQQPFAPMTAQAAAHFYPLISAALAEDGAFADITSNSLIPPGEQARADVALRSSAVVAGLAIAALAFTAADSQIAFDALTQDGARHEEGAIARVHGPARGVLCAERVALNLLGRLSGIATLTRGYVDAVRAFPVRICDTRKTTPGLRALERYAVRAGGGFNHRFNLSDAVLIKDNHLATAGSVANAVAAARANIAADTIVEVECDSIGQVREALEAGADAVLLDNMALDQMRQAVELARGRAVIEASGGITLANVLDVAKTGVDIISVGALTHSADSANVALDFITAGARTP